jgi:hypothetical protein
MTMPKGWKEKQEQKKFEDGGRLGDDSSSSNKITMPTNWNPKTKGLKH